MFIFLNSEHGRVGEAISVVLTFEANYWKRFSGHYLHHQKCSFKGRKKMKMFEQPVFFFKICLLCYETRMSALKYVV